MNLLKDRYDTKYQTGPTSVHSLVGNYRDEVVRVIGQVSAHGDAATIETLSQAKLKGSIGEVSNHSNFSHQNSVKILSEQAPNGASRSLEAPRKGLGSSAMQPFKLHSRKPW